MIARAQPGHGLEARRKAVMDYLNGGSWELVASFTDIESGKPVRHGLARSPKRSA